MKKIVKRCLIISTTTALFLALFSGILLFVQYTKYRSIPLNVEALTSSSISVDMFAKDNTRLDDENIFNGDYCKIEELKDHTKQAFISIEDKEFYHHNGINKKRIAKATFNNIKSRSLKEGASTITQQLIKNTHLSSEKTFDRKLKEIALAQKLEKVFSKDEIMESYLNIIFFGNNCFGIENASNYYFGKNAKDLSLEESCTLAGIIKSPTKYSPISNYDNCLARRNLVLDEMEKDGYISTSQKLSAQNLPISLNITKQQNNKLNTYSQASLDEASKILNLPTKQIAIGGYKIHTYFDKEKQNSLMDSLSKNKLEGVDNAGMIIDNKSHGISAYYANSNLKFFNIKRQPASAIKPLLVYAPALNENIISPSTQILDEKIEIGNYKPENVNKKFAGYMSVTDSVKNSVNIPAIKVLSYIGIETGKEYAQKLGITFDEKDTSYTLALGGMTYGTTLNELTTAYTTFANEGNFAKSTFIQYITDKNDKLVYIHKPQEKMVFRNDSNYLMTNILQETAKTGTARKLSNITNTQVASKTGTVGKKNGNTDAYNITVTPTETIGVWFGNLDNKPTKITGGNQPTSVVCDYIKTQEYKETDFNIPSSVTEIKIDSLSKENEHRIVLASPYSPERYTETALFSRFNTPTEVSSNFVEKPTINAQCAEKNGQIEIKLKAEKHIEYQIFKNEIPYQSIKDKSEELTLHLPFNEKEASVKIYAKYANDTHDMLSNEKSFTLSKTNLKTSNSNKWYI